MSLFEIKRRSPHDNISIELDFATVRGKAIQRDTTTPTKGALANGHFLGFVTRDVTDGGPSEIDRAGVYPGRLELDDDFGQVTLELADAVEAEGDDYVLTSGTGALSNGTSIGTLLSFVDGKFYIAQANDEKPFRLAKVLTAEVNGNLRIYAERVA